MRIPKLLLPPLCATILSSGCATLYMQAPPSFETLLLVEGNGPLVYYETDLHESESLSLTPEVRREAMDLKPGDAAVLDQGLQWFKGWTQVAAARNEEGQLTYCVRKIIGAECAWTKYNSTGTPIAQGSAAFSDPFILSYLAPLVNHYSYVQPLEDSNYSGTPAGLAKFGGEPTRLGENLYEDKYAWSILMGLIGWGKINERPYMQFLWIPIPLAEKSAEAAGREERKLAWEKRRVNDKQERPPPVKTLTTKRKSRTVKSKQMPRARVKQPRPSRQQDDKDFWDAIERKDAKQQRK